MVYLNVYFSYHEDDNLGLNFWPKLSRLKRLLDQMLSRNLSTQGKLTVIKSFAISRLVFLFVVLNNPADNLF